MARVIMLLVSGVVILYQPWHIVTSQLLGPLYVEIWDVIHIEAALAYLLLRFSRTYWAIGNGFLLFVEVLLAYRRCRALSQEDIYFLSWPLGQ